MLAEIVHAENVGMIERGYGTGFLLEAAQTIGIGSQGSGQNLDGYIAAETLTARWAESANGLAQRASVKIEAQTLEISLTKV